MTDHDSTQIFNSGRRDGVEDDPKTVMMGGADAHESSQDQPNLLRPGKRIREYVIERVLGVGGFGVVYLATHEHMAKKFAIKELFPRGMVIRDNSTTVHPVTESSARAFEELLWRFLDEARRLSDLECDGLVRVYAFWKGNGTAYMAMEYCEGTQLKELIRKSSFATPETIQSLIDGMLPVLERIHNSGYVHRDISPDNIIIRARTGKPVLLDFGAMSLVDPEKRAINNNDQDHNETKVFVKESYSPIEQFQGKAEMLGPWTDIYAMSAVLYHAITGHAPVDSLGRSIVDNLKPLVADHTEKYPGYHLNILRAIDWGLSFKPADRPQTVLEWRKVLDDRTIKVVINTEIEVSQTGGITQSGTVSVAPPEPSHPHESRQVPPAAPVPALSPVRNQVTPDEEVQVIRSPKAKPKAVGKTVALVLTVVVLVAAVMWFASPRGAPEAESMVMEVPPASSPRDQARVLIETIQSRHQEMKMRLDSELKQVEALKANVGRTSDPAAKGKAQLAWLQKLEKAYDLSVQLSFAREAWASLEKETKSAEALKGQKADRSYEEAVVRLRSHLDMLDSPSRWTQERVALLRKLDGRWGVNCRAGMSDWRITGDTLRVTMGAKVLGVEKVVAVADGSIYTFALNGNELDYKTLFYEYSLRKGRLFIKHEGSQVALQSCG